MFFKRGVIEFNVNKIKERQQILILNQKTKDKDPRDLDPQLLLYVDATTLQKHWICMTCHKYGCNRIVPPLNLARGLDFPEVDPSILDLNEVEERLCSPRIAFQRIKYAGWDQQRVLRGNVVNVPIDVEETVKLLPRSLQDAEYIEIKLMRRMNYKHPYLSAMVRPKAVEQALNVLERSPLFKKLEIVINRNESDGTPCIDLKTPDETQNQMRSELMPNIVANEKDNSSDNDDSDDDFYDDNPCKNNPQIHSTMLVNLDVEEVNMQEALGLINKSSTSSSSTSGRDKAASVNPQQPPQLAIAPGQYKIPISAYHDEFGEEATFLKIFGGHLIDEDAKKLSMLQRCKSYFRRHDRRCAQDINYIFYMYRKLMTAKLLSSIQMSLKRLVVLN